MDELRERISKIIRDKAKRFCGDQKVSLDNSRQVHCVANMAADEIARSLGEWTAIRTAEDLPETAGRYLVQVTFDTSKGHEPGHYADIANFSPNDPENIEYWRHVIDWMPIPPYQPQAKEAEQK